MKPRTLEGQILEATAAWFGFLGQVCQVLSFAKTAGVLRQAAADRRRQWHELERQV